MPDSRFLKRRFLNELFSICYIPLANVQSPEMVGFDSFTQFLNYFVWGRFAKLMLPVLNVLLLTNILDINPPL